LNFSKFVNFLIIVVFGCFLIYASLGLPNRGDAEAAANLEKSPAGTKNAAYYYIQNAKKDAHTDNMVTVILADYRGFDTLGEETVIFTAGLICWLLLRKRKSGKSEKA
jgi:multicomponent Na+:H+ antiporter subunit B